MSKYLKLKPSLPKSRIDYRFCSGGTLRQQRAGRKRRPISTKCSVHLIFKANKQCIRGGLRIPRRFSLVNRIVRKYQRKFFVKVEQISTQNDHLHLLVRTTRRSNYQSFFRVVAGQIAQQFENNKLMVTDTPAGGGKTKTKKLKLWLYRPFTRVVVGGWRALQTVRNYIQLNEKEALGVIPYRKNRLRGLSSAEWEILWQSV